MLWTFDRFCSRRRGRSQGGVGILQIVGIRAGDLRDSTVLFGAHPCPTIATAVQPGMFRSTKINQLQSRSRYGTRGLLGVFAFAMRRSRVRSPSAPVPTVYGRSRASRPVHGCLIYLQQLQCLSRLSGCRLASSCRVIPGWLPTRCPYAFRMQGT